jgi:hypothetical protein
MLSASAAAAALILGSLALGTAADADENTPPVNLTPPAITGVAVVGSTITASTGTWTDPNSPSVAPLYSFVWSDALSPSLATTPTYVPTVDDIGQVLTVTVKAENADYGIFATATATTAAVSIPDAPSPSPSPDVINTIAPSISGSLTVGSTLTLDPGSWTAPTDLTYTYSWGISRPDAGDPLPDEGTTHVITASDVGFSIGVSVTATTAAGEYAVARASTERIVPPSPFATDAGLTSADKGSLAVTQPNKTTAVVTVPGGVAGTSVYVYAFSTPVGLGFSTLDANGALTVNLATLAAGEHRLLVLDSSGAVIGWVSVTVGSVLAATGGELSMPLVFGGGALVLFGLLAVLYVARQRRIRQQDDASQR